MPSGRMQQVEEGDGRGRQPDALPPDHGELPLDRQVRDRERPQETVLHLPRDGRARDHGNAEARHDGLLHGGAPLQPEDMPVEGVVRLERPFDLLPGR